MVLRTMRRELPVVLVLAKSRLIGSDEMRLSVVDLDARRLFSLMERG
jgi:hypothetical protein